MKAVYADTKKEKADFLRFRKRLYAKNRTYIDNMYFMVQEIFDGKLNFVKEMAIFPVNIRNDQDEILAQGIIAYAKDLPEYIQLCFFEAKSDCFDAVKLLVDETLQKGRERSCSRMVVGLYGHVNYGLGLLASHYDSVNSFSSAGNPAYYNTYFQKLAFEEVQLNTYLIHSIDTRLSRYQALIDKLNRYYEFRVFDKKQYDYYSKIYTDLNNACFLEHRYYYQRDYVDDREMLDELFLFMKGDSIIFAFRDDKPVGFIMWYPDYNELAKPGEVFGAKHYVKNLFSNRKIQTAKVMEFGVLKEYQNTGLPLALIDQIFRVLKNYGCTKVETSWILEENEDSNSVCKAVCDENYKDYVVYETEIE